MIESVSNSGDGIGKCRVESGGDGSEGDWVVFVPYAITGEKVSVRISKNFKRYSQGSLARVLEASPHRVEPKCEYFTQCSGCQYQHMSGDHSREMKRSQVKDAMSRIGGMGAAELLAVSATVGAGGDYGYRTKLTPHLERRAGKTTVGFVGAAGALLDVRRCDIASEAINRRLTQARAELSAAEGGDVKETLLFRDCAQGVEVSGSRNVTETVGGIDFHFRAGDFFQNNRAVLPLLVEHLRRSATAGGMTHLVDCYCGSGLFSLALAGGFDRVYGVEVEASAVASARSNAQRGGIDNVSFLCASAERIFAGAVAALPRHTTAVIMDPPRSGADKAFIEQLLQFSPRRIVYVSCDPATQARDLKLLLAGGYRLEDATPFDMFPNTKHIECVATLVKHKL